MQRLFSSDDDAEAVFDFVDAADGAERRWARDGYRLVSRMPRCVLHRRRRWPDEVGGDAAGAAQTLLGAGLQGPRVLLFMEQHAGA
ncbi:hypothetical protein H632_c1786p2 [Helicosporidium sp. ATCC 50920]|nr:hypothetical protein H632_c1786p2 [Helicosporidium sp. ATCC 50920]|eukprot:KDD73853.1 hypothetical protein H632_c1786p2 [Helicosporidium sp. ATCC 50920]